MLLKISLVVALCSNLSASVVQKRLAEIRASNPGTEVQLKLDKKAVCSNGQVLTGRDAKALSELGK